MAAFEKYRSVYTHDELMEKKGKYYQLYTGNFAEETA